MVLHMITVWYIVQDNDQFSEIEMGWSGSTHGRIRNAYLGLDRKPERTIPLLRSMCSWKNTIKTVLEEIWVCLAQDVEPL
jgi:hypothetical protein